MELEAGSESNMYRVSCVEETVGKLVKTSKIRFRWEFFVRGRHHTVVLAWSKTTGKQELTMDSEVVWFGRHKGRSVLDHHWTTPYLKLHVLATCAPKLHTEFRNCDLVINGQLFADLPVYNNTGDVSSSSLPEPPHDTTNATHPQQHASIIQILYPNGYVPPDHMPQEPLRNTEDGSPPSPQPSAVAVTTTTQDPTTYYSNYSGVVSQQQQQQQQAPVDLLL